MITFGLLYFLLFAAISLTLSYLGFTVDITTRSVVSIVASGLITVAASRGK